jgi:hypothetical protein
MFRLEVLKVDRSEKFPLGSLTIGVYLNTDAGENPWWTFNLVFRNPDQEKKADVIEVSYRLMGPALNTMADLLAPNVAATNRARMQAEHETGPSVPPDEPIPLDDQSQAEPATNSSDNLPRAARPATTKTDLNHVQFEKHGF